jgi:hypothetical protein
VVGPFCFQWVTSANPFSPALCWTFAYLSLDFQLPKRDNAWVKRIGASSKFNTRGGKVPSSVAEIERVRLDHGEDVAMMNFRRAAVFMMVFALTAMAQDYSLSGPLSHRMSAGESASLAERATLTVPAETEVKVQVLSGIHTQINHVNDPVIAEVLKPVFVQGMLALPPGSLLDGHITMIRNAGHMRRSAELGMRFDRITLPDGQEKPVAAVLAALEHPEMLDIHLDPEGHLTSNRFTSWRTLTGGFAALGTYGALKVAAVGSAGASLALPIGGVALISYETLWHRGREVNMPPDTPCRLRLNYPLTVHIPG